MTGLSGGLLSGWTMRILVPLTLLDACLVRAIVLFWLPLWPIFRYFSPGLLPMGCNRQRVRSQLLSLLCCCSAQLAERSARVSRQESWSSWKRLLAGVPDPVNCTHTKLAASKTLALEGSRLLCGSCARHTLLRTTRAELCPETSYIIASYAHARVTAVVRVLFAHNSFGRRSCSAAARRARRRNTTAAATAARHHRADAKQQ